MISKYSLFTALGTGFSDGSSEFVANMWTETDNLFCLRNLFTSTAVVKSYFLRGLFLYTCATHSELLSDTSTHVQLLQRLHGKQQQQVPWGGVLTPLFVVV